MTQAPERSDNVWSNATCRVGGKRFRDGHGVRGWLALTCFAALSCRDVATAATAADKAAPAVRDGQRDFDCELGSWEIHLKKRLHPLTGSSEWARFDGTSVTRKVWNGRAQIEEFETDGAAGRAERLTLRLYNPQTHQWSLYWANGKDEDGHGEFYALDTVQGRTPLVVGCRSAGLRRLLSLGLGSNVPAKSGVVRQRGAGHPATQR